MNRNIGDKIALMSNYKIIIMLFRYNILKNQQLCIYFNINIAFKISKRHIDEFGWRYIQYAYIKYQTTLSIRYSSILSSFRIYLKTILKASIIFH